MGRLERDEVLETLNQATQKWKDTGDADLKLKPAPISWKTRIKLLISRVKPSIRIPKIIPKQEKKNSETKQVSEDSADRADIDNLLTELNKVYKK